MAAMKLEDSQAAQAAYALPLQNGAQEITVLLENEIKQSGAAIHIDAPLPMLRGQRSVIQQVLVNLISNAIKFTADGVSPQVTIRGEQEGEFGIIHVLDNGIGIAPEPA